MQQPSTPEITIVGPGRLGRTVALALTSAGWTVRLLGRGAAIPPSPLTWLTVPDDALSAAAAAVPRGGIVLHASGATDIEPLRPHAPAGSLHPLMTFPGPEVTTPAGDVPAAVAGDPDACAAAWSLADALGWRPFAVPGDRALYHAAAVIAGNYATTLLAVAADVLAAAGVDARAAPALLAPLALASVRNAAAVGPAAALTGPASRGDEAVIDRHRRALADRGDGSAAVYDALLAATRDLLRRR